MTQIVFSSSLKLSEDEKNWIENNPKVKVAMAINNKPFSYKKDAVPLGLDFDLLNLIEKKTNIKFEKIQNTWGESVHNFKSKQVDMITSFGHKKEREAYTLFTSSYYSSNLVLKIYANKNLRIDTNKSWAEIFRDKKIGIIKNISFKNSLIKKELDSFYEFDSKLELLQAVSNGIVDFIIIKRDLHSSDKKQFKTIKKYHEIELVNTRKSNSRIGVAKDKKILYSIMQKALVSIPSEKLEELKEKWKIILSKKNDIKLTNKELLWLEKNPIVKVAMPINYKPFSFKIDGVPVGLDFDLLNLIEQKTNLKFEKIQNSWGESVHNFKTKQVDMITSFGYKKDRDDFATFTKAYFTANLVLKVYGRKGLTIDTNKSWAENFANKKVGIIKNISFKDYLEEKGIVSLFSFDSKLELLNAVLDGKVDFMIINKDLYDDTKEQFRDIVKYNEIELTDYRKSNEFIGIVKDKKTLHSIIQKALNTISKKEIDKLYKKWETVLSKKSAIKLTKEELDYLKSKNNIKICVSPSWIPFEQITKENQHIGISADILQIIERKIEKNFVLVPTKKWKESKENLKQRKCDILPLAMETPNRLKSMNFTKAYITEPYVIATKLDEIFIRDKEQLIDKKIAIVENSALIELMRLENLKIQIIPVKNTKEGLEQIRSNKVFAFIGTIPAIGYTIQKHGFVDLKIAGKLEKDIKLSIASRNDEPLLNAIMQKALDSIPKEEIRKIGGRWIEVKVQQEFDYKTLLYIVVLFIFIVIVILYQNRLIRKKVKEAVEKNQEQERLIFFQSKLATMGETINVIAHQWRQPIAVTSSYLNNIQVKMEYKKEYKEEEILKSIKNAQEELQYISSTITLFQSYLKPKERPINETFELNDTIERSLKLFEAILEKYSIEVKKDIPSYIKIKGNQEYFIQVLMVLMNNTKDAIVENEPKNPYIKIRVKELEDKIIFSFEDNAKGIKLEENIFDPYISGKDSTGLGLFIARNIVIKIFKGKIDFKNIKDGAQFIIEFPI